ncbi:MAG: 5-formyltetrahydrofolate cyclo-ligase [Lachnospiraceae bacterium]|nr:5-formyltetrahydrofolate cyclo-ligase [Lachnospiraceae bacterium]
MTKSEIRRECRARRTAQFEEMRQEKSRRICEYIEKLPLYRESRIIYAYISTQGEVDLSSLIEDAWARGLEVAVPRVHGETMDFYQITSWDDLEEGSFHIREPREGCPLVTEREPVLFLVPGVAYDTEGFRVGYGGGFYDRYLAAYPMHVTIGVGFDFQIYPEVPREETDCAMREIVTETGFRRGVFC